jgi:hypothetical protein
MAIAQWIDLGVVLTRYTWREPPERASLPPPDPPAEAEVICLLLGVSCQDGEDVISIEQLVVFI